MDFFEQTYGHNFATSKLKRTKINKRAAERLTTIN